MTDFCNNSVYFGVAISLVGYVIGVQLKKKFKLAVLNPLMISIIFVVGVVLLFKLDYPSYKKQAEILNYLLTPATIALAIPLYQQLSLLRKNLLAVICGIISGVLPVCLACLQCLYCLVFLMRTSLHFCQSQLRLL